MAACLLLTGASAQGNDRQSLILGIVSATTNRTNPLTPVEREFMSLTALVYESMIVLDDDYLPKPHLADKWESSGDGSTWTFTLREGVTFHDGTPLTSADVVATVNEILRLANDETNPNKGAYASLRYFINKIAAPDERTVVILSLIHISEPTRPY